MRFGSRTFRGSSVFDVEIPFTGGTTLGDAFDWSQLFMDRVYSHMVSVELQSRNLAVQTDPTISGNLNTATFKLQLGAEAPVTVTVSPGANLSYSNTDLDLSELVTAVNDALDDGVWPRVSGAHPQDRRLNLKTTCSCWR
jgi:hypothetical protein